jgi:hypothetical protein
LTQAPPVEDWATSRLLLDRDNPRLPADLRERDQIELLRYFVVHYDLEELGWSMAEKGYFAEEPLLTTSAEDPNHRIVVEGNRRLATLKLLTNADARAAIARPLWEELAEFAREHVLDRVPTRLYQKRQDLLEYLGFRHVSGLMQWTADAKARYVRALVIDYGYSFQKAGRVIGSRQDAIRRQFIAWQALEQARTASVDITPAVEHFGVFYRALQNPRIREFLTVTGWVDGTEETLEPLGPEGPSRLEEFLGFVFGNKRVIRESRQLDDLGRVLGDKAALAILRADRDLSLALQELPADRDSIFAAVRLSYRHAAAANAEAFQFADDAELVEQVERLRALVERLHDSLMARPKG